MIVARGASIGASSPFGASLTAASAATLGSARSSERTAPSRAGCEQRRGAARARRSARADHDTVTSDARLGFGGGAPPASFASSVAIANRFGLDRITGDERSDRRCTSLDRRCQRLEAADRAHVLAHSASRWRITPIFAASDARPCAGARARALRACRGTRSTRSPRSAARPRSPPLAHRTLWRRGWQRWRWLWRGGRHRTARCDQLRDRAHLRVGRCLCHRRRSTARRVHGHLLRLLGRGDPGTHHATRHGAAFPPSRFLDRLHHLTLLAARVRDLAAIDREERGEPGQHAEPLRDADDVLLEVPRSPIA